MVILCVIPAMSDFGNAEARSVFRVLAVASETLFFVCVFLPFFFWEFCANPFPSAF